MWKLSSDTYNEDDPDTPYKMYLMGIQDSKRYWQQLQQDRPLIPSKFIHQYIFLSDFSYSRRILYWENP